MKYNLDFTDINFLSDGFEVTVDCHLQYYEYSNIVDIRLHEKSEFSPICILLKLENPEFQEVSFYLGDDGIRSFNSSPIKRFKTLCETLVEKTKLEIPYEIYPKYFLNIINLICIFLIITILIFGWHYGFFEKMKGPMLVGFAVCGVVFVYRQTEKRKFGKRIISINRMEELDVYIKHKLEKRGIYDFE